MINFCLLDEEKLILKNLIGKKLIRYRHDPLDKFDQEAVYGRVELFFDDSIILIDYDYKPFPLFGSCDDHPKFTIKKIEEAEAVSALKDVSQINVLCGEVISSITLVEDYVEIEWDSKKDSLRVLKAIILKFKENEIALQGDYMIPLLDIIKGKNVATELLDPGDEYKNDPEINYKAERFLIQI